MPLETIPFDPAEYIQSAQGQLDFIQDALDSGNEAYIADAIGIVARARGMAKIAKEINMPLSSAYKSFSKEGNPTLTSFISITKALGFKLECKPL